MTKKCPDPSRQKKLKKITQTFETRNDSVVTLHHISKSPSPTCQTLYFGKKSALLRKSQKSRRRATTPPKATEVKVRSYKMADVITRLIVNRQLSIVN